MALDPEELIYNLEDKKLNFLTAMKQRDFNMLCEPPEWLRDVESPFKWMRALQRALMIDWNIPGKLLDYRNQGAYYGFEKYTLLLAIAAYESYGEYKTSTMKSYEKESQSGDSDDESEEGSESGSEEKNEDKEDEYDAEKSYAKCAAALEEMVADPGNVMYNRIGPAMHHVLQATRAHMLYFTGNLAESQEITKHIQPVMEMPQHSLAGMEGIKAKVVNSMYEDVRVALKISQKAEELDPNFAPWKYYVGKYIRLLRRRFKVTEVTREELVYFEKAVELDRDPKHLVFLAQAYQEMWIFLTSREVRDPEMPKSEVDELLKKSVDLYRECWSLKKDSAAICRRIGNGMMKMKSGFIDITVAKEALLKSIELSSYSTTFHELGRFYYKHEKDDEKALEYFEKIKSGYYGPGEVLRLKRIRDPEYDPDEVIKCWEEHLNNWVINVQNDVLCDIAWYYLVLKRDLEKAAKCLWRVLKNDWNSFKVMEFKSYAFCVYGPLNLLDVMVNEILLEKNKNKNLLQESRRDMTFLDKFLEKVLEKHPEIANKRPERFTLQNIKMHNERAVQGMRRNRYGDQHGHDSNQRSEAPGSWRRASVNEETEAPESLKNRQNSRRVFIEEIRRLNQRPNGTTNENGGEMRSQFDSNREANKVALRSESDKEGNNDGTRFNLSQEGYGIRGGVNGRQNLNRGGMRRQYNNSRYDVTITDWRSENRNQGK